MLATACAILGGTNESHGVNVPNCGIFFHFCYFHMLFWAIAWWPKWENKNYSLFIVCVKNGSSFRGWKVLFLLNECYRDLYTQRKFKFRSSLSVGVSLDLMYNYSQITNRQYENFVQYKNEYETLQYCNNKGMYINKLFIMICYVCIIFYSLCCTLAYLQHWILESQPFLLEISIHFVIQQYLGKCLAGINIILLLLEESRVFCNRLLDWCLKLR